MLGAVPSNLIPYFDFNRFSEYLVDGTEVAPTTPAQLDANVRAVAIVNAAQGDVAKAARKGDFYELQQLRDLVRAGQSADPVQNATGQQILILIADLAWAAANTRKRYTKNAPQGDDPARERAEAVLEQLRDGERIFVLDGVQQTDGAGNVIGTYGEDPETAGLMQGSQLVADDVNRASPLWGCKTWSPTLFGGSGGGCGGW